MAYSVNAADGSAGAGETESIILLTPEKTPPLQAEPCPAYRWPRPWVAFVHPEVSARNAFSPFRVTLTLPEIALLMFSQPISVSKSCTIRGLVGNHGSHSTYL